VLDREGLSVVLREGIRILEEIEVEDDAQLAEILLRDVNSPDTSLYHGDGVGFFQMPVHKNATNRRTGAYTHIKNTLDARDEEGNPLYPLTLSMHSLATKILFDTHRGKPKAVGLEYLVGEAMYGADSRYNESNTGELRTVTASQEVIIAGGAFNTPQILKLSGVGPRAELEQHQIPVVKDLPAVVCACDLLRDEVLYLTAFLQGNYMQDNYEGGVSVRAPVTWEDNPLETEGCDPSLPEDPCMIRWLEDGSGPYGDSAPSIFTFRSSVSENEDADIIAFGFVNGRFTGFYPGYSSDAGVLGDVQGSSWSLVKMQTGNTAGTVELRSSNPREPPSINFNYFQEQGDRNLQVLAEGTEFVIEMLNAVGEPYTPLELLEPVPGVDTRQSLMDQTFSHHVTSTCRMGRKDDPDYCVDSKFRVNGIEGLQVVDASVFPRTPGGFPVAPTFIIGQKAFRTIVSELEIL
jgi:choline dehydrogenase